MKIIKCFAALLGAALVLLSGCTDKEQEIAVTGVTLTPSTLTLGVGETQSLSVDVQPSNATNKNVSWSTDDPSMSIIALSGTTVKALTPGKATVTVTTEDGGRTATCAVTVVAAEEKVSIQSITLALTGDSTLGVGESASLAATVTPANATEAGNLVWKSSDEAVATVSASGNSASIKAVAPGSATISVSADGKSAEVAITVIPQGYATISLGKTELTLAPGETAKLEATCTPENVKDKTLQWSSSDNAIATVDSEGTVTAKAVGAATITVKSASGEGQATCAVTVAENVVSVESVAITPDGATLNIGEEASFTAKITPADATNADQVVWAISDATVAELTAAGGAAKVKALAAGSAELTATVEGKSAKVVITVNPAAQTVPEGFVDMGLPSGTIWARENLGTDSANPRGLYFAWGEVEPKSSYTWENYKYKFGDTVSKYNDEDGLSLLESEDDAATVLLGQDYHTPTLGEWAEVLNPASCSLEWTSQDGINGILLTSVRNGKTLFLPSTGWFADNVLYHLDEGSFYWTSTCSGSGSQAFEFRYGTFYSSPGIELLLMQRRYGQAVRPVYAPRPTPSTGITVPQETIEVEKGKTYQLTASVQPASAPQTVVWETESDNIELNYWTGEVVLKSGYGAVVYAFDGTGGHKATITLKVKATYPTPDAVDLGLPSGTKWASWDLGASAPEEPGYFFAWGETEPKISNADDDNYKWFDYETWQFTKYDENDCLEPEDDAASVHLGGAWQIPSMAQVEELINKTSMRETEINGMKGMLVTGPNLNTIFLPYGGTLEYNTVWDFGEAFHYQINQVYPTDKQGNWIFYSGVNGNITIDGVNRYFANCIRAVQPGGTKSAAQAVRELGPVSFGKKAAPRQRQQPSRGEAQRRDHRHNHFR